MLLPLPGWVPFWLPGFLTWQPSCASAPFSIFHNKGQVIVYNTGTLFLGHGKDAFSRFYVLTLLAERFGTYILEIDSGLSLDAPNWQLGWGRSSCCDELLASSLIESCVE